MQPDRNAPCPCGSGKKFKKCHGSPGAAIPAPSAGSGSKPSAERARAAALKKAGTEVDDRVVAFAATTLGEAWIVDAIEEYLDVDIEDLDREELSLAIPAIMHFMPADDQSPPPAQLWARRNPRLVTGDRRIYLHACENAWLSIWKVARVDRGIGSALVDTLTARTAFVHDAASSNSFRVHDAILAIMVDCEGVQFFGALHPRGLDPIAAGAAIDEARRICRVRTRPVPVKKLQDLAHQLAIVALWKDVVAAGDDRPMPEMRNTDGDPMVPTTDDFALAAARAEVVALLAGIPGAEAPERSPGEDVVVVVQPAKSGKRGSEIMTGRIVVTDSALRAETNSTRRADELRRQIEQHAGARVRHRLREETDIARELAAPRAEPRPPGRGMPASDPESLAMMREWKTRYMREWLDESIPMIDGLTPRAAAKDPRMATKLLRLVEHVERAESSLPESERIDLSFIRVELGIRGPAVLGRS